MHPTADPVLGAYARTFREYLAVHPAIELGGHVKDEMALELAHIALAMQPEVQRAFRVRIVMPDGSIGCFTGHFASGFDAIDRTHIDFPEAKRISALFLGVPA